MLPAERECEKNVTKNNNKGGLLYRNVATFKGSLFVTATTAGRQFPDRPSQLSFSHTFSYVELTVVVEITPEDEAKAFLASTLLFRDGVVPKSVTV